MIKTIVSVVFAAALMGTAAYAQSSSSSTTVATDRDGMGQTTTTTTESTGVVTEFTPGQGIWLQTTADKPVQYKFGKKVTYVTSDGKVIEPTLIKKDSKVNVHYIKDGNDMLVEKVVVTEMRD